MFKNYLWSNNEKKLRTEYCNGQEILKVSNGNYSKQVEGETIVYASNDSILSRIRNQFFEEDLLYIHESIHEHSKKPTFRNITKLDKEFNILSVTVFDPEPEGRKGVKENYYTINYTYNSNGQRIKKVRYEANMIEPRITRYEYYKNGLLKKEIRENLTTILTYEYK